MLLAQLGRVFENANRRAAPAAPQAGNDVGKDKPRPRRTDRNHTSWARPRYSRPNHAIGPWRAAIDQYQPVHQASRSATLHRVVVHPTAWTSVNIGPARELVCNVANRFDRPKSPSSNRSIQTRSIRRCGIGKGGHQLAQVIHVICAGRYAGPHCGVRVLRS